MGKGEYYDHKFGFNAGRNEVEIARAGGKVTPGGSINDMAGAGIKGNSRGGITTPGPNSPAGWLPGNPELGVIALQGIEEKKISDNEGGEMDNDLNSISLMSDISSGELMQRYPPMNAPNNDFVKNAYGGLFLEGERRAIFEHVLPEVLDVMGEQKRFIEETQIQADKTATGGHGNNGTFGYTTGSASKPGSPMQVDHNSHNGLLTQQDIIDDPLYALYHRLQARIDEQEHIGSEQFAKLTAILEAIQKKTDTIKEKKLRPVDFE